MTDATLRAPGPVGIDRGPARALATNAVVACLRRHVGRGPDRARAAFLGPRTITVELRRVLTSADRTLARLGRTDAVDAYWWHLGLAISSEVGRAVSGALDVEASCTSWVIDAEADCLLLVFNLSEPMRRAA